MYMVCKIEIHHNYIHTHINLLLPILLHFLADAALVEEAQRNGYVSYNIITNTKGYVQRAKELSGIL